MTRTAPRAAAPAPRATPPSSAAGPGPRALLLVAALAVLPYLLLPANPLIIDAGTAILENKVVQEGSLADIFGTDFWGVPSGADYGTNSYRPLVVLTFWAQVRVLGNAAWAFRALDLALHAGSAVLLALLLARLLPGRRWAVPGAALFAVHPVATEAVCSAVGRADLMASAAFLGALVLHLGPREQAAGRGGAGRGTDAGVRGAGGAGRSAGIVALLAAALLSKEYAVAFPLLLVGVDLLLLWSGRIAGADLRRRAPALIGGVLALVAYLGLRVALFGELGGVPMLSAADHPLYGATAGARLANAAWLAVFGLRLLVIPYPLTYFYTFNTVGLASSFVDPRALAGVALLLALLALATLRLVRRRDPLPLIALGIVFAPLAPSLNTVSLAGVLFAERFLYLSAGGFALAVAWAVATWLDAPRDAPSRRRTILVCGSVVLVLFALGTAARVREWRSAESLTRAALRHYPDAPLIHFELGLALGVQGRHQEAAAAFERSLALRTDRASVWKNYAVALGALGRHQDAAEAWRRCLELSPKDIGALWRGLGMAQLRAGQTSEGIEALGTAFRLMPQDEALGAELARTLVLEGGERLAAGRPDEAARLALRALETNLLPPQGLFQAALLLHRSGEADRAAPYFAQALRQDPDLLRNMHRLAVEFDGKGQHAQAAELFRQILVAQPDHVPTLFNLGHTLLKAGRPAEAIGYFEAGLDLAPDPRARALLEEARRQAR